MSIDGKTIWFAVGFLGQALFAIRFIVQWLHSEARGKSVIPRAFWYFSVAGGAFLLSYAIYRREVVFVLGEFTTLLVFLRNLWLLPRRRGES
ncbi:MAG: lipid A biosynthesis protein [Rhodanobacter sp.]|nr:MAG: lipid A biosynthesis protein [Rhodanobacter sp.]TAM42220.1 MAG: lipid A biosynthesis protein [Rhodanobacter sp.]TAN26443.1 MAG: lipid A biosynthesis protein [Rhodanobacter sp.]